MRKKIAECEKSALWGLAVSISEAKWERHVRERREMFERDGHLMSHPAWPRVLEAAENNESWAFWVMRTDRSGVTPLMKAAMSSCEKCVSALLPYENALARCMAGKTALMCAAERGSEGCCRLLLGHSDAMARDDAGRSAWDMAANRGCREAIEPALRAWAEREELCAMLEGKKHGASSSGRL